MAKDSVWLWSAVYVIVIATFVRLTPKDKPRILPFRTSLPHLGESWDTVLFCLMFFVVFPFLSLIYLVGTSTYATIALWSLIAAGIFLYFPGFFRMVYQDNQENPMEGNYRRGKVALVFGMLMLVAVGFLGLSLDQLKFHLETPHRYEYLTVATDPQDSPQGKYITFEEYPDFRFYDFPTRKGQKHRVRITNPDLLARK